MADGEGAQDPPAPRGGRERAEHERAFGERRMGDGQAVRTPPASAPQGDVEVEHARTPAAAGPASETALYGFEPLEHLGRIKGAFDQRDGIGEIAPGAAVGWVQD